MKYLPQKMIIFINSCFLGLSVLVLSGFLCSAYTAVELSAKHYTTQSSVISIAAADIDGNGVDEIIIGTVDNSIHVRNIKGETVWKATVSGIPLTFSIEDIDGNGKKEIAAIVQDAGGTLCLFDYRGNIIWTYKSDFPFLCLDIGDIDTDGKDEIVVGDVLGSIHLIKSDGNLRWKKSFSRSSISSINLGDINNDRKPEIVIGTCEDGVIALDVMGNRIWKVSTRLKTQRHHSERLSSVRSVIIDDIDSDGKPEILVSSRPYGMISIFDEKGKVIWQKQFTEIINSFSSSLIGVGNLVGDTKKEIVALLHGTIWEAEQKGTSPICILDYKGNVISSYQPKANFYSFFTHDTNKDGIAEILMSSSTRGNSFYLLQTHKGNQSKINGLEIASRDKIDELIGKVRKSAGYELPNQQISQIHVLYSCRATSPDIEKINDFLSSLKGKNLVFELIIEGIHEKTLLRDTPYGYVKQKKYRTQSEILEKMQFLERKKIPFFLLIGTHCELHITLETLEKILQIAPSSCRGFVVHEDSYSSRNWNSFVTNVEKVLFLCKRYGKKKLILNEHKDFWYRVPLLSDVYPRFFKSEFRDILIPMYKSNTYVNPELNIGTILGLWSAGKVKEWGFSTQEDAWIWESTYMVIPDDVLLRMEVMAASLGATYFRIEIEKQFLERAKGTIRLSKGAKRHRDLFHQLIRKSIIRPISNNSQVILSPVAFKHMPLSDLKLPKGWKEYWRYFYQYAKKNSTFGYQFPLQTVREDYLPGYIYDLRYYEEAIFPKTNNGFFQIVPYWIEDESLKNIRKFWVTDGRYILEGETKLDGLQAKEKIIDSFRKLSETMPFRADGVFMSVQKFPNDYLIYLLDTGCLDIEGVDTIVKINSTLKNFTVLDAISNEKLSVKNREVALHVPAGTFRILRVILRNETK